MKQALRLPFALIATALSGVALLVVARSAGWTAVDTASAVAILALAAGAWWWVTHAYRRDLAAAARRQLERSQRLAGLAQAAQTSLAGCGQEIDVQCTHSHEEMGRLRGILTDAIGKLLGAFNALHALSARQKDLALAIVGGDDRGERPIDRFIADTKAALQLFVDTTETTSVDATALLQAAAVLPTIGNKRLSTEKLIFVGASTGGTEAVRVFLQALPADAPGVLITQHMPPGFTRAFAQRLDGLTQVRVAEASDGERVLPGHAYIAPGGRHLALARSGANYVLRLSDDPPVNRHRPSVDVLFDSAALLAGRNAIGVILTGMGKDGAAAMRRMRDAGAYNFAQDEATSIVFGMPKEAIVAGAVHEVLPLERIAPQVLHKLTASGPMVNRV